MIIRVPVEIDCLADLEEALPGPLSPRNPVKYAAYEALMNARGKSVKIWVGTEEDLLRASWCGHCNLPKADPKHPNWPADFQPQGPDDVPPGFCNGIGCNPGAEGMDGEEDPEANEPPQDIRCQ
jgi:hypothetical protein